MTSLTKGATRMTPAAIVRSNGQKIAQITVGIQKITVKFYNVITKFIDPKNVDAFEKIILNSSIITFGAKLKILRNIERKD